MTPLPSMAGHAQHGGGLFEVADGVHVLGTGPGIGRSNSYFVASGSSWVLIDAGWSNCAEDLVAAAASLYGPGTRPETIVLTHIHPDHSGSARELAERWDRSVLVHPGELPSVPGRADRERRLAG